ncbi:MAG: hypothetical protein GX951_02275, partial [Mollicutes bacterium]|nr:hypothetical protein [Mollicutes bacterium]
SCSGNPRVWTNTNKVLCITSNTKDVSGIEEVYWSTPLAPDKMISGKTYEVKVAENSYVIEVYKARVKYNDGKNYLAKAEVRIDKVKPTCIFSGESTVWTNNNRAITLGCEDELSGCKTEGNSFTKTYTTTIKTDTFPSYEISDNVGNKTNCEGKEVDVYIDKDAPTISCVKSVINQPNGVTINCDCLDNDSGVLNCDSESIDIISNFTSSVVDKAGNSSTFITEVSSGLGRKDCETCKRCSDAGCESTYKCRCKTCEKTKSFFLKTYGNATLCFWKCESEHPGYSSYTCNLSNGLVSCYGRKKVYYDCECDTCCSKYKSSCLKCGCKTGSDWYLDSTCEPSAKVECSTIYY